MKIFIIDDCERSKESFCASIETDFGYLEASGPSKEAAVELLKARVKHAISVLEAIDYEGHEFKAPFTGESYNIK